MAPNPSSGCSTKQVADEATWASFRASIAKMTRRQRAGFRLYLLREGAKEGDQHAATKAESLAAEIRRADAIDAHATELQKQDHGLTKDRARYLAEAALNTNETDNHD